MQNQSDALPSKPKEFMKRDKPKRSSPDKEDKIDSVFIAREMMLGDELNLPKRLLEFKMIKNQNYDKFTDRCHQHLKKNAFGGDASFDRFVAICQNADNDNTSGSQMGAIFSAFRSYWMNIVPTEALVEKMFAFIERVYPYVVRKYVSCVRKLIDKVGGMDCREDALAMANRLLKRGKIEENRVLPLIYQFQLYGEVPYGRIVDLVLTQSNPSEAVYIFQSPTKQTRPSLLKALVDRCSSSQIKSDFSKCEHILRALDADPFLFPNYITKLQERYISYLFRTYKLFYIELIICHDRDLVCLLVEMLGSQGRKKEAEYFVFKYQLQKQFGLGFSDKEKEKLGKIKNVLIQNDGFGPTEEEVLEEDGEYLRLEQFGITREDIIVVDKDNIEQIDFRKEFSGKVGLDQETSGGTHVFDPPVPSLLQFYNGNKIFIFDCLNLRGDSRLSELIGYIFENCQLYGQDLQKEVTGLQKELEVKIDEKIMQDLAKNRLFDSGKMFKKAFPKETKSNLAYLSERLWGKKLSKYEQCSGWTRRPLRLAQLHYAAFDCVLPLKICQKLSKERSNS